MIVDEYVPAPTLACMVTEEEVPKLASVLYTTPMLDAIPFVELMTPSITAVVAPMVPSVVVYPVVLTILPRSSITVPKLTPPCVLRSDRALVTANILPSAVSPQV